MPYQRALWVKKSPGLHKENGDFLTQSGALGNGDLLTPKPSFPDFGDFDPCRGRTRSQSLRWPTLASCLFLTLGRARGAREGQVRVGLELFENFGPEKGVITKGVFSLEECLHSLSSLESLANGRILLCFPKSGGFSRFSRISKDSRISRKWAFLKRPLFLKTPFSELFEKWKSCKPSSLHPLPCNRRELLQSPEATKPPKCIFDQRKNHPHHTILAVNSDHGLSFAGEETRTMVWVSFSLLIFSIWRFKFSVVWVLVWVSSAPPNFKAWKNAMLDPQKKAPKVKQNVHNAHFLTCT